MKYILVLLLSSFLQLHISFAQNKLPVKKKDLMVSQIGTGSQYCSASKKSGYLFNPAKVTQGKAAYDVKHIGMELDIDPAIIFISGSLSTLFEVRKDVSSIEMELNKEYNIDSIVYNNSLLDFQHSAPWTLIINFPSILETGSLEEITIYYHGVPSTAQGFGSVGFDDHNGSPAMWTLSEPYGARDWWPGKNDLTDKIDSIDVVVKCPQEYRTASNGLLKSDTVDNNIRTNHWKHKYPIAPYLVAIAVTNYAVYSDTTYSLGEMVPVLNYVYPENLDIRRQETQNLIPVMPLYSDLFVQYPFIEEKYGHAEFGWGGGMEHQTMTFMGVFHYEIMAHELAHQWFGDMVTTNSWHDIWLNEGFATYLTGLTYEHLFDGYYWPIWKEWNLESVVSQPGGSVYVQDTTNINRIFDSRLSYSKGALVLHSLRWVVGDENFFTACNRYLNDPVARYGFASTDLLKEHMESVSGKDLTEFFNDWYYGEGYPSYTISVLTADNQEYTIILSQSTSHPSVNFFEMPVPVRFTGTDRDTLIVFNHTANNQQFVIKPGFAIQQTTIDPDQWIISANNQVLLDTADPLKISNPKVYPNPAISKIRIDAGNRKGIVLITDIMGRNVMTLDNFSQYDWIDVSHLRAGIYYIKITGKAPAEIPLMKL
ncbi:MAG TPA: M1 family aminopeptidase [Lentimicrobium sp.]|nr:M1 family aminopeptidase [Lentimicrobium sp.]